MRQPLVAGNWKMNGSSASVTALLAGIKAGIDSVTTAEMAVCPPYVYIPQVASTLAGTPVTYGAQDVSDQESGAYTGEVSVLMLRELHVHHVILGHSERRSIFGESDAVINAKMKKAREANLKPIFCIGETLAEREAGKLEAVLRTQVTEITPELAADICGDLPLVVYLVCRAEQPMLRHYQVHTDLIKLPIPHTHFIFSGTPPPPPAHTHIL